MEITMSGSFPCKSFLFSFIKPTPSSKRPQLIEPILLDQKTAFIKNKEQPNKARSYTKTKAKTTTQRYQELEAPRKPHTHTHIYVQETKKYTKVFCHVDHDPHPKLHPKNSQYFYIPKNCKKSNLPQNTHLQWSPFLKLTSPEVLFNFNQQKIFPDLRGMCYI